MQCTWNIPLLGRHTDELEVSAPSKALTTLINVFSCVNSLINSQIHALTEGALITRHVCRASLESHHPKNVKSGAAHDVLATRSSH